jgi:carboxylesterase type B
LLLDLNANLFQDVEGVEDCLHINVFSPTSSSEKQQPLLPVLFWIHGGGFFAGSGNVDIYGPEYIMDFDVVLVSFNYRQS